MVKRSFSQAESSECRPGAVDSPETLQLIAQRIRDIRFGQVTILIQDGIVVMIERTEKHRLI